MTMADVFIFRNFPPQIYVKVFLIVRKTKAGVGVRLTQSVQLTSKEAYYLILNLHVLAEKSWAGISP